LYAANVNGADAGWGWSAWERGLIDELALAWELPPGNHYLWDFVTRPEWRGHGLYPRLLQAILVREAGDAERFWIGHVAENHASERGILKAGFRVVGGLHTIGGDLALAPLGMSGRAQAWARVLGVAL